jgi:hypothetical protein
MESPHYELLIRARPEGGFNAAPEMIDRRLGSIPGVTETGPRAWNFGEPDEHGVMEIHSLETGEVSIRIPRPWVVPKGPQVFALVFMISEWCDGEVFDAQIEDTLQRETVLQGMVAMRQAQREQELKSAPEKPAPMPDAPARPKRPWWKRGS